MNKGRRFLALIAALMLLITSIAFAEDTSEEAAKDPVLFTLDGMDYTASQVQDMMATLYEYGYVASETDYYSTIQYIFYTVAEQKKIAEMGFDQFTDAENEAFLADAQVELDALVDEWVAYYQSGSETEEELENLRLSVVDYFASMGYDTAAVAEELKYDAAFQKLIAHLEETNDLAVTEDEVTEYFNEGVELDRQEYENDVAKYEMYTSYYGVESWYIPAGYRNVLQILLEVDEALLDDYQSKLEAYQASLNPDDGEEAIEVEEEGEEKVTVTLEEVEAAREACLESRRETIDEIYTRLENGEQFADLIPEYNTDPGMMNEDMVKEGYMAHPDSYMDEAFLDAAFSDKVQKPGDVSDPSLGIYGIYIVYYLRESASGPVELTDELYASIEGMLSTEKMSSLYNTLVDQWAQELEVTYNEENMLSVADIALTDDGQMVPPEYDEEVPEQE